MKALHVGIAGAGLAGRLLAWRLARAGLNAGVRFSLFDSMLRDNLTSASQTVVPAPSVIAIKHIHRDFEEKAKEFREGGSEIYS